MKRFVDYNPTKKEIANIFGTEELYKFKLERFDRYPGDDYEKLNIASLLSLRGECEEALKMINSIEDKVYRRTCLQLYASWGADDYEIIN